MRISIALFVCLAVSSPADGTVRFGVNEFAFEFEDASLESNVKTSIAASLVEFIAPWTNAPVVFHDDFSGSIAFGYERRPHLFAEKRFPAMLRRSSTNELFHIVVDKAISDKYLSGIVLTAEKSHQTQALGEFILFLNSAAVWNVSEETAARRIHYGSASSAHIREPYTMRDVWTNEVTRYEYRPAAPWSFFNWPLEDETQGAFSVELPVLDRTLTLPGDTLPYPTSVILSWIDGVWKFHPVPF